jgi:hypothetical protein
MMEIRFKTHAVTEINKLPHVKARLETFDPDELRVTFRGLSKDREEAVAYYTTDPQDAYDTAVQMEKNWRTQCH